tara:strand:+ start:51 stop:2651 length:2601 start_codon:yes stop_codon:yes gene_type:complete
MALSNQEFFKNLIYYDIIKDSKGKSGDGGFPAIETAHIEKLALSTINEVSKISLLTPGSFEEHKKKHEIDPILGNYHNYFIYSTMGDLEKKKLALLMKTYPDIESRTDTILIENNVKFIIIDASMKKKKFLVNPTETQIIETPGSFIDPGGRAYPNHNDYIVPKLPHEGSSNININLNIFGFLNIEFFIKDYEITDGSAISEKTKIDSIKYTLSLTGQYKNKPYVFTFKINRKKDIEILQFKYINSDISIDNPFKDAILKGNKEKNNYINSIESNKDDIFSLKKIIVILLKELGDCLQAIIPHKLLNMTYKINTIPVNGETLCLLTCDTNLGIRCKLLEMQYLLYNRAGKIITHCIPGDPIIITKKSIIRVIDSIIDSNNIIFNQFENLRRVGHFNSMDILTAPNKKNESTCLEFFKTCKSRITNINTLLTNIKTELDVSNNYLYDFDQLTFTDIRQILITLKIKDVYYSFTEVKSDGTPTNKRRRDDDTSIFDYVKVKFNPSFVNFLDIKYNKLNFGSPNLNDLFTIIEDYDEAYFPKFEEFVKNNCIYQAGGTLKKNYQLRGGNLDEDLYSISCYDSIKNYVEVYPQMFYTLYNNKDYLTKFIKFIIFKSKKPNSELFELIENINNSIRETGIPNDGNELSDSEFYNKIKKCIIELTDEINQFETLEEMDVETRLEEAKAESESESDESMPTQEIDIYSESEDKASTDDSSMEDEDERIKGVEGEGEGEEGVNDSQDTADFEMETQDKLEPPRTKQKVKTKKSKVVTILHPRTKRSAIKKESKKQPIKVSKRLSKGKYKKTRKRKKHKKIKRQLRKKTRNQKKHCVSHKKKKHRRKKTFKKLFKVIKFVNRLKKKSIKFKNKYL